MNARRLAAALLLLFAVTALVWLAVRELRGRRAASPEGEGPSRPDQTVVYYFHPIRRCEACERMEAYLREAVPARFADALRDGRLEFRGVNYEAPGHKTMQRDYQLFASMVVLVEFRNGARVRWKNLDQAWGFALHGKADFDEYVLGETEAFLAGASPAAAAVAAEATPSRALLAAAGTAFGLGLLTALSPCALATNIAAISFLARRAGRARRVLLAGLLYALGLALAYVGLGVLLAAGLLSVPGAAEFLGHYVNSLLGPVLVVAGTLLLGLLQPTWSLGASADRLQAGVEKGGLSGALPLGFLLALAFCPTTAAFFFGSLLPLTLANGSGFLLPCVYAAGAGLPVVFFALVVALAAQAVGRWFNLFSRIEVWLRAGAGALFIVIGVYYSVTYIFRVPS